MKDKELKHISNLKRFITIDGVTNNGLTKKIRKEEIPPNYQSVRQIKKGMENIISVINHDSKVCNLCSTKKYHILTSLVDLIN